MLPDGDMVFVPPELFRTVVNLHTNKTSKKFVVLCTQGLEYLVEESIQSVFKGAWAKSRTTWEFDHVGSDAMASGASEILSVDTGDGDAFAIQVQRTFVHFEGGLLDASAVTQSSPSGMNPRVKAQLL